MFTATLRGGHPYRITAMSEQQTFSVDTIQDSTQEVVEVTIRCSRNMIQVGLDVARMQVEALGTPEAPPRPQLEPGPEPAPANIWDNIPRAPVINRPEAILPRF
ncbi:hypothetical protein IQ273_30795 [Nodosilinea sp. LEGE 07298]|uniref:hypothetical protein n=1 Tax=Nodosilinea sp. LEGE 07298 TaxID=2777970 RepID=UPI001882C092|nr:hypothetical protein [Nodosilinea sp. LEGE 07298]MBE9113762.1 hypothetical protein [Nodosilinea sp. LEGE 07298]